jgi:hypothetical protein
MSRDSKSSTGKGDTPRPFSVDQETYKINYDRIFGNTDDMCEYSGLPSTSSYAAPLPDGIQNKIDMITDRLEQLHTEILTIHDTNTGEAEGDN